MTELAAEPLEREDRDDFFYVKYGGYNFPIAEDGGLRISRVNSSSPERYHQAATREMIERWRRWRPVSGESSVAFSGPSNADLAAETRRYLGELPTEGLHVNVKASLPVLPFSFWQRGVTRRVEGPDRNLDLPVGFGYAKRLGRRLDGFTDVGNIVVDPDYRGLGVGRTILHSLLRESPQYVEVEAMIRRDDERIKELAVALGFSAVPFREHMMDVGEPLDLYRASSAREVLAYLERANPWLQTRQPVRPIRPASTKSGGKVLTSSSVT